MFAAQCAICCPSVNIGSMYNGQYTIGRDKEKTLVKIGNVAVLGKIVCIGVLSVTHLVRKVYKVTVRVG